MTPLWLLYGVVVAGVVGAAAAAVEGALLSWGRPVRAVWIVALGASLLLPVAAATLPSPGAPPLAGEEAAVAPAESSASPLAPAAAPAPSPVDAVLARAVELARPLAARLAPLDGPVRAAWALGSGGLLLLLLLALRAVARRRSGWRRETVEGRRVLVAPDFGPAVVGVRRPEIVLPEWALRLERRLLRLVLLHEEAHRSSGDTALLTAGLLAVAAAPWNPFLWWQLHRLRLAVEIDCDRRVLGRGVSRVAYGRLLLEVGRRQPGPRLALAALAEPRSFLERRIRMITTRGSSRSPLRALAALGLAALLVVVACETPTPTALEEALDDAGMTVEDVVRFEGSELQFRDGVLWYVDGVLVEPASVATALDPGEIHRIEVLKGEAAGVLIAEPAREGVIRITTRKAAAASGPGDGADAAGEAAGERPATGGDDLPTILQARQIAARVPLGSDDAPVIVVDGEETDLTVTEARDLDLDIERIEILRGEAAHAVLGDRPATGVIRITTRDPTGGR